MKMIEQFVIKLCFAASLWKVKADSLPLFALKRSEI